MLVISQFTLYGDCRRGRRPRSQCKYNERNRPMDTFEVEQRETLTRDEAATRLRRIANLLSGAGEEW